MEGVAYKLGRANRVDAVATPYPRSGPPGRLDRPPALDARKLDYIDQMQSNKQDRHVRPR